MERIKYLDGMRGIAILLVFFYHAYTRWIELMPFGDQWAAFPLFKFGYLGVELFFLISGFVILMTLERCKGFSHFLYKRWLRLFPGMLVCSLFIYFSASFFFERPRGIPPSKDLIPGLLFIEPYLIEKITGFQLRSMEGAFWSLYIEFKFYIIAALLYFVLGSKKLVIALFACFLSWVLLGILSANISFRGISLCYSVVDLLGFKYFGWFAAGAAYYSFVKTKQRWWLFAGIVISMLSGLVESKMNYSAAIACSLISVFFFLAITNIKVQDFLSSRLLLLLGFVSYPLYLIHENMMLSLVIKFSQYLSFIPGVLFPFIAILILISIAYAISKYCEPFFRTCICFISNKISGYYSPYKRFLRAS
ncbi:acyltransferase [Aliikangiella sp. G2MR2-5]|uniref:acyltransferase family protein n=1 Tax=Aliikangiella sp. G2MR2-5 TaxID=2788943 RepID=UPI0018A8A5E1|nr:acyltransferase [Aliikangiella sp. G2MR2-5]